MEYFDLEELEEDDNENEYEDDCCPECGSNEFCSEPNQYDITEFVDGNFEIIRSTSTNNDDRMFCAECGEEVDVKRSEKAKKIVLKPDNNS